MSTTQNVGQFGENLADEYYHKLGYTIREKNFRTRMGEVDVICSNREYVVFVEVKLRKNADFAYAREQVTVHKQRRIIAASLYWLQRHRVSQQPRFDVVEIYAPDGEYTLNPEIHVIENAFSADIW